MSESGRNKKLGLRRFLGYRKGELSGEERNSFERELQKDPFAEESIEGMLSVSPEEFSADLKKMKAAILLKSRKRKKYMYYRIAASVAVLMIVSSVFFVLNKGNRVTVLTPDTGIQTTAEILKPEPVTRPVENVSTNTEEKSQTLADKKSDLKEKNLKSEIKNNTKTTSTEKQTENYAAVSEPSESSVQLSENRNDAQLVTDYSKEVKARSLPASGRVPARADAVSADDSMPVTEALEEVVVTGYGRQDKESGKESYLPPKPLYGMDDFNRYIEKNIHRPDSLTGQRVVVVAVVSVKADGSVNRIRILRSPGPKFSEEALRLIRSGPQWLPAQQNGEKINDSVRVRIVFR